MFVLWAGILGNLLLGASILVYSLNWAEVRYHLPWLFGRYESDRCLSRSLSCPCLRCPYWFLYTRFFIATLYFLLLSSVHAAGRSGCNA